MTHPLRTIRGSLALVTGAASGMGRATARLFAQDGALVAVTDVDREGAAALAAEIVAAGGTARGWALDVGDPDSVARVVDEIGAWHDRIDVVVNNAGISSWAAIDSDDYDAVWDRVMRINATGQQRVIHAALPWLRQAPHGRIVNIASTEALGATSGQVVWLFLSQSLVVGVVGVTTGFGLGMLALSYRNEFLHFMNRMTGFELFPAAIYNFSELPALIVPRDIGWICGSALVICMLAGVIPAWTAGRLKPVEALRHE